MSGGSQTHTIQFDCRHYMTYRWTRPWIGDLLFCRHCDDYRTVTYTCTRGNTTPYVRGQEVCQVADKNKVTGQ